ncbi:SDR family NAD(P)-dependent oxidoreductase [Kribbella antibiotica]|uniref:SDR family NAD(P)-dependent oxidoreductase n=1 Tax=Kribbella antibiotica TaxID=190195 RepID=A0A4V2YMP6_9ACTN|nr:SDR family NAD(P)-dependent oxidoreductase [Kribbella antibiotica]TDD51357.1 SDR family NAD(P)-dependent oxidoreductase [Kribbella antibiotica]
MRKVLAVLGAGPGLGLSIAHRFGREGFTVALVSRSATRHPAYLKDLQGIDAHAYVADVRDPTALRAVLAAITADLGPIDTVYFGPVSADGGGPVPITEADAATIGAKIESLVLPAIDLVDAVLPDLLARNTGTILIPGGLSGKYPIPMLGALAPASAALRMYVLTLNAALKDTGVHAATLTIGGLIEGGDIHTTATRAYPTADLPTLDPVAIADAAWAMYTARDLPEREFNALQEVSRSTSS